jgi:ABC-type dipeptide/oligopeptide/nickel transport system permease component
MTGKPLFLTKLVVDSLALFFISTFIAHALLYNMEGDYVSMRFSSGSVTDEQRDELREQLGISGLFPSYMTSLKSAAKRIYSIVDSEPGMSSDSTLENLPVLLYARPTLLITFNALLVYLLFMSLTVLCSHGKGIWCYIRALPIFLVSLIACVPVFVLSWFLSQTILSYGHSLTWNSLFGSTDNLIWLSVPILSAWALILGLGDGAFIEGARGLKEEYIKLHNQPFIMFQRINGGKVNWHLTKAMLPYILGVCYFRFLQILGGTIVVENVFDIKGLGFYLFGKITERNLDAVFSVTMFTMLCVCIVSIFHRLLLSKIDPRYRSEAF